MKPGPPTQLASLEPANSHGEKNKKKVICDLIGWGKNLLRSTARWMSYFWLFQLVSSVVLNGLWREFLTSSCCNAAGLLHDMKSTMKIEYKRKKTSAWILSCTLAYIFKLSQAGASSFCKLRKPNWSVSTCISVSLHCTFLAFTVRAPTRLGAHELGACTCRPTFAKIRSDTK